MKRISLLLFFALLMTICGQANAATRFWVGGTGTWDSSTTTHWSATTGGAGGASVPGASDTVTFDGSSGGGTVTLNFGGTISIQSLTLGAFTGTWDNNVNNNNVTMSGNFNASGSGTRTLNLGTATYTLTGTSTWDTSSSTNMTYNATASTVAFTATTGTRTFNGGVNPNNPVAGTVTFAAATSFGTTASQISFGAPGNITTLSIAAPNYVTLSGGQTLTVTNPVTIAGSPSAKISFISDLTNSRATMALAAGSTFSWVSLHAMGFTGAPTAPNSFDVGFNTGITITSPNISLKACILGGWLLWRDLTPEEHDNFPAFLDKEA